MLMLLFQSFQASEYEVMYYYVPSCSHCKRFKPKLVAAQLKYRNVNFNQINCQKQHCENIFRYPSVIFTHRNLTSVFDFSMDVELFIESQIRPIANYLVEPTLNLSNTLIGRYNSQNEFDELNQLLFSFKFRTEVILIKSNEFTLQRESLKLNPTVQNALFLSLPVQSAFNISELKKLIWDSDEIPAFLTQKTSGVEGIYRTRIIGAKEAESNGIDNNSIIVIKNKRRFQCTENDINLCAEKAKLNQLVEIKEGSSYSFKKLKIFYIMVILGIIMKVNKYREKRNTKK
ncbi:Thioredoxin_domain [Hexamita inflata]|uniref:Thioredoxin domain n=1 Tax=Hexamita inflata TaxID=28002 RepID=A0AA86US19_9EUKA|nr:Thioredoxin domain [Hexamita inflata]